jgi:hypothetical protein
MSEIVQLTIDKIEVSEYSGIVYNLETENEEYIAAGIVVHNCPHLWDCRPDKIAKEDCPLLWMGQ